MKTRKHDELTGPFETMSRADAFDVLKRFIAKHGIKLTAIKRSYVAGMVRVRVEGLHTNGARFFTAIEDRHKIPEARGLDYTLEGISLSMVN